MLEPLYFKKYFLILLAGGILDDAIKAFIKLNDSSLTIIEKIFDIFSNYDSNKIENRIITLPNNYLEYLNQLSIENSSNIKKYIENYKVIYSGYTLVDTIKNVLDNLGEFEGYLLFVATDTPFVSYESINDIIFRLDYIDGDVFFPIVSKEVYEVKFSNRASKLRTFVKLKKDSFCGTSIFVINKKVINSFMNLMELILNNRKKPLKLAEIFGYDILFKFILGDLTVVELEEKISQMYNIKVHAVLTNYAELAFNIDKKEDLLFYRNFLSHQLKKTTNLISGK